MGEPAFVLSVLLTDLACSDHLVLGVRRASPQSDRHPHVLSTPTQRLPPVLFAACQDSWPPPTGHDPRIVELPDHPPVRVGGAGTSADPVSYAVEALLCRKLGLTEALAEGRTHGVASRAAVSAAVVEDPKGSGSPDPTVMLTVRVVLANLLGELPGRTAFFDPIVVRPATEFVRAVECNDALVVEPTFDPFEVCIGGLCVTTGAVLLRAAAGGRPRLVRRG